MKTKDFSGIKNNSPLPNPHDVELPDDIGDLLGEYIDSAESQLSELEQAAMAYEAGDGLEENAAAIRRILHKIKGESGMVGFDDISELCHLTEDAFEELSQEDRPDMLLRFKDWLNDAIENMKN